MRTAVGRSVREEPCMPPNQLEAMSLRGVLPEDIVKPQTDFVQPHGSTMTHAHHGRLRKRDMRDA